MLESSYPSTTELVQAQRARRILLWSLFLATVVSIVGLIGALALFTDMSAQVIALLAVGIFLCLAVPVAVWNKPILGLYIFLTGALVSEYIEPTSAIPTSWIPFLHNLSTYGEHVGIAVPALKFSVGEVLILFTFLAWLVRSIAMREFRFERGAFFGWITAYILAVCWGFFHGVTSRGDSTMALWEVRAQFHFFIAYLMAANLITERRQVSVVLWLTLLAIGFKGIVGTILYAAQGFHSSVEGIMSHEESLLVNMIFFVLFISWIGGINKKLTVAALLLTPTALITELANQRRAGIAAFIIAFIPLLPILWFSLKQRRKQVATFAVVFGCVSAVYLPIAWNGTGAWALPARAIKSQRSPDARDSASNVYRIAEEYNIKATRDLDPWRGIGYGKPFGMFFALPHVTTDFMLYLPHNSVMWVWMRIGHFGFFCFMMMIAFVLIRGCQILKETQDPFLQMVGALGIACLLMVFAFGKYDVVLANYRVMILTGTYLGILSKLRRLEKTEPEGNADALSVKS
jgi:hypothetical protein